jgi:hypothetical protein
MDLLTLAEVAAMTRKPEATLRWYRHEGLDLAFSADGSLPPRGRRGMDRDAACGDLVKRSSGLKASAAQLKERRWKNETGAATRPHGPSNTRHAQSIVDVPAGAPWICQSCVTRRRRISRRISVSDSANVEGTLRSTGFGTSSISSRSRQFDEVVSAG